MNDRTLLSIAAGVGFASLWDFLAWSAPLAMAAMQILGGVLPYAVAAPTGSMQPTVDGGDRLLHDAGVGDVSKGDVIVYTDGETDYAHRAMFHVEAGENWYDRADPDAVGDASGCEELGNCPAPRDGWVTKGDANPEYDQAADRHGIVADEDIEGRVVFVADDEDWPFTAVAA
ncbi:signal peptidase I [Haloarcula quadrata]|uniref:Signal peptidase I n=1 Tax=Haloarcula quadrata TaxID=182779 RepID=A0A495R569_9EURY|nr:S26 family signal peptidase [Haloarcula quadrata]RKS82174.1 signal peptidase I [Haloarcula quadrata]